MLTKAVGISKDESTNNLTDKSSKSIEVYGATYIQDGIKQGADILINEKTTTYTDSVSGQKVTRTPNILLLSDGCPTLGTRICLRIKNLVTVHVVEVKILRTITRSIQKMTRGFLVITQFLRQSIIRTV